MDPVSGAMVTGERVMGGKRYTFNPASAGVTGWHYDGAAAGNAGAAEGHAGAAEGHAGAAGQVGHWSFDGGSALPMGALMKEE